jgi:hypothetical protein
VDALLNSRGVTFEKPTRQGIRPIAICEAWLCLAAIVCIRLLRDAGSFAPLQLGVGINGGADNISHAINNVLRSNPANTVVSSYDWVEAFNTIPRPDLFAAVASRHPSMVPFANLMYGAHTTVRFFSDHESGTVAIASVRGVHQGDPLCPSSLHRCSNTPLRPLLMRTLPCTQLLTPMTHTS